MLVKTLTDFPGNEPYDAYAAQFRKLGFDVQWSDKACHAQGGDVACQVLRLPSEALPHRMPGHLVAEFLERVALGRMPRTLDELHNAHAFSAADHAERQAKGRGRFAFAGAGMDDEEPLLDLLTGHLLVLDRLALRHLGAMALGILVVDWLGHGLFTAIAMPATIITTRTACAAIF